MDHAGRSVLLSHWTGDPAELKSFNLRKALTAALPAVLSSLGGYDLTYGSLGGVMVVLIFFFVIGLGVVAGAELNAALAEVKPTALKGEIYSGPFADELEVDEPEPGEDVDPRQTRGIRA